MKIAAIIPAHNEGKVIRKAIISLRRAEMKPTDIFVVDDVSTDQTSEKAREAGAKLLILARNVGKSTALKQGINHFQLCENYDYVVFMDADSEVDENCLKAFEEAAENDSQAGLFAGQVKSKRGNYISAYRAIEYAIGHDLHKSGQSRRGLLFIAPGCASMYKSEILKELKFENNTLAEDMDLTMQVQRKRLKIIYVPEAIVYTQDPKTLKDYLLQITRWQRGVWQVIKKHRVMAFQKKQNVDWLIIIMVLDALLWSRTLWLFGLLIILPLELFVQLLFLDITFLSGLAVYTAFKNRRLDVIYKFPRYFWLSYLSSFVFIKTFAEIMVFRKEMRQWSRVKRY